MAPGGGGPICGGYVANAVICKEAAGSHCGLYHKTPDI